MKRKSFVISLALLVIHSVSATDYYVDKSHPSASDSNPGSESMPWSTIQRAANVLVAGDRVYVKGGIYTELFSGVPDLGIVGLKPQNSGTLGNPITYEEYPGQRVIIDQNKAGVGFYLLNKSHIVIKGFEIRNVTTAGVYTTDQSSYITVERNHIHHIDGATGGNIAAIKFDDCNNCVAKDNKLHDVAVAGDQTNQNSAAVHSFLMRNALIENNEMFNAAVGVFHKRSYSNTVPGAIIRRNIIHDVHREGIRYSVAGSGNEGHYQQQVYENIFYNITLAGVYADVPDTGNVSQGIQIYNNTFDACGISMRGYQGVEIFNNIFFRTEKRENRAIVTSGASSGDAFIAIISYSNYNLFYENGGNILSLNFNETGFAFLSEWQNALAADHATLAIDNPDGSSIQADPEFTNLDLRNYKLRSSSAALGVNSALTRPGSPNSAINLGAYSGDPMLIIGPRHIPEQPTSLLIQN